MRKVILASFVADRKVLDEQLQNIVYQFDHVDGVVQKIEKNAIQNTGWYPKRLRSKMQMN